MPKIDLPPLARYRLRDQYTPKIGDYIVWSGWLSTWHGIVTGYAADTDELMCVFAGVPYLLMILDQDEYDKETTKLLLSDIRSAVNGKFAILQQDSSNAPVWYI